MSGLHGSLCGIDILFGVNAARYSNGAAAGMLVVGGVSPVGHAGSGANQIVREPMLVRGTFA